MLRTEWIDRHVIVVYPIWRRGTLGAKEIETDDTWKDYHLRQLFLAEDPHA